MHVDVLLCDYAQVEANKIYLLGGGFDTIPVETTSGTHVLVSFAVSGTLTLSPEEASVGHELALELVTDSGAAPSPAEPGQEPQRVIGEMVFDAATGDVHYDQVVPFAGKFSSVALASRGVHHVVVSIAGVAVRTLRLAVGV